MGLVGNNIGLVFIGQTNIDTLKARTHNLGDRIESVLESADYIPESANYTTDSVIVG